jgi:pseudouridine-5'-phosphate glycosidase
MADKRAKPIGALLVAADVSLALKRQTAVVALESAVITHGLPFPTNLELARDMEAAVREEGATPATIALIDGQIRVGLAKEELARLAQSESNVKLGPRDLASGAMRKSNGGTTVGATMFVAARAGIPVFATGGIGGVHREMAHDVSADLHVLATTPMIVVCAGAKAILDLPATLEILETMSVPVIGYQTEEFPAFYSRESGLSVGLRLESAIEIADYWEVHRALGLESAILVTNPIDQAEAIPRREMDPILRHASAEARQQKIQGKALTPFLLGRIAELSKGRSIRANLALLLSNAHLAAQIATTIARRDKGRERQL